MTRSPAEWDAALRDALDRPPRHVLTSTQVFMALAGEIDALARGETPNSDAYPQWAMSLFAGTGMEPNRLWVSPGWGVEGWLYWAAKELVPEYGRTVNPFPVALFLGRAWLDAGNPDA